LTQFSVLAGVALLMTVGVYGVVAGIVKMDDLGLYLSQRRTRLLQGVQQALGRGLVRAAPMLMKALTLLGTAAMFLVGGGILAHGWHGVGEGIEQASAFAGALMAPVVVMAMNLVFGLLAGACALAVVTLIDRVRSKWL
jgi:predicted DNA repair protein MutK